MKKRKISDGIFDGIVELILCLIFFGIGWGILKLLGFGKILAKGDFELITLIGIAVVTVVVIVVAVFIHLIRKKKKIKKTGNVEKTD